jgi:hypothetical protein
VKARRRPPATPPSPAAAAPPALPGALLLAAAALATRVLFVRATPDSAWAYSALFKGDAPLWVEAAAALRAGLPFELGLPIHPPGTAYLLSWLWSGAVATLPAMRIVWAALGALVVGLAVLAARRSFGPRVAAMAGVWCCASTGLVLLSASLDAETPYLVLVTATLALFEDVRGHPRAALLAAWAALHGIACLFRVEHALYFALMLVLLAVLWARADALPAAARRVAVVLVFFVLPLVPWHWTVWRAVARFDTEDPQRAPAEEAALRSVEEALRGVSWDAEAARRRDALPAFCRRTSAAFVAGTVVWRGENDVHAADLAILEEAFGSVPRPIGRFPFVSVYGPLNFALANHPGARGGFDRGPLDAPPPLAGGIDRYPPLLVRGLPPPRLSFDYPPHVRLVTDGYALGARWIAEDRARFVALAARKLRLFWEGAALGLTGYDVPLGTTGVRRAVDLATPARNGASLAWQAVVLLGCAAGVAAGWRRPATVAWLLFAASKLAVTVAFFGYARQGATIVPVVAVALALAAERGLDRAAIPAAKLRQALVLLLAIGVGVEAFRCIRPPALAVDGVRVGPRDEVPEDVHRDAAVNIVPNN